MQHAKPGQTEYRQHYYLDLFMDLLVIRLQLTGKFDLLAPYNKS